MSVCVALTVVANGSESVTPVSVWLPVLVSTSVAAIVWPHAIVIAGCEASGQLWLTNDAPHGIAPYAASTDFT